MPFSALLEWWNFIFALPLAIGLILVIIVAVSGLAEGGSDSDDTSHSDSLLSDGEEQGTDESEGLLGQMMSWFGIGIGMPTSLAIPILMIIWGLTGIIANNALAPFLRFPAIYAPISSALGLSAMILGGRTAAMAFRRFTGDDKPSAVARGGLVGNTGRSVYTISGSGGVANVKDLFGNIHRVECRVLESQEPIPAERPILLTRFDYDRGIYFVEEFPLEEGASFSHQTLPEDSEETLRQQQGGH